MPRFAVIIPAYNEELIIDECLQSLVNQRYRDFKAYIVDDASLDSTRQRILRFQETYPELIKLCEFGKVGPGRARNLLARQVDAEFLAFMDADCIATPFWLEELLSGYLSEEIISTGGPHLAPPQSNDFQLKVERFLKLSSSIIDFYKTNDSLDVRATNHNPLCNVSYRRKVFNDFGGFREDLFPGEDIELDLRLRRAGLKISYNPKAIVFHHRPDSLGAFRKVMFAYGRSQGKMIRERGPHRLIHFVGIVILATPTIGLAASISLKSTPLVILSIVAILILFVIRPKGENFGGIFFGSFDWFKGLLQGFLKNRSTIQLGPAHPNS